MNAIYDEARRRLATATLDWRSIDLVLVAMRGTAVFNPVDKTVTDVMAHGAVAAAYSLDITMQEVAPDGYAQTDQVVIPGVTIGAPVTHFTMCQRNVVPELSQVILFIDDAEGLPFTPNGLDMAVTPDWLSHRGWFRA